MARLDAALAELGAKWGELAPEARSAAEEALVGATLLIVDGVKRLGPEFVSSIQPPLVKVAVQAAQETLLWGRSFDWVIARIEAQFPRAAQAVKEITGAVG